MTHEAFGNPHRADQPQEFCMHRLIEAQVERTPEATAVIFEGTALSYRELNQHANRLARRLKDMGVGPETPVAVCMERCLELAVAVLGLLKAGGVLVPLDPDFPPERNQLLLRQTGALAVLTRTKWIDRLPVDRPEVLCLDDSLSNSDDRLPDDSATSVGPDHLCAIFFTSGSTGSPKGVMVPHSVSCRILWAQKNAIPLSASDRRLLTSSLSYASFLGEFCAPLFVGGAVVLARPHGYEDIDYLLRTIETEGITVIGFVPAILRLLVERLETQGAGACRSLRHIFSHGEALSRELQARLTAQVQAELHKFYGLTEAPAVSYWNCRDVENTERTTIGRPTDMAVYLLDPHLEQVPMGMPGEIYVGGPGMAMGYLGRPDLTAERFIPNPFGSESGARLFRTGDLGRWLPEGVIEFLGRVDDQVKLNGVRIEVREIESALVRHPDIEEAVVALSESQSGAKRLVAWVQRKSGRSVTADELRRFSKGMLPTAMVPAEFFTVLALPRTANGKVDRKALRVPDGSLRAPASEYVAPRTPLEARLADIWCEVLRLERVGVHDNFFELGGDSLLVWRLLFEVEKTFGVKLPLATIFDATTVERFAAFFEANGNGHPAPQIRTTHVATTPLFCLDYGLHLAKHLGTELPVYALNLAPEELSKCECIESVADAYIKKLRAIQLEGPYAISGYSSNGIVAFAMAQQLTAQGQEVAFLGILDHDPPSHPTRFVLRRLRYHVGRLFRAKPAEIGRYLFGRAMSAAKVAARNIAPPVRSSDMEQWVQISLLQKSYRPVLYNGSLTLFVPEEAEELRSGRLRAAWAKLTSSELKVVSVPGNHFTMVREPNVRVVAQHIKNRLVNPCDDANGSAKSARLPGTD